MTKTQSSLRTSRRSLGETWDSRGRGKRNRNVERKKTEAATLSILEKKWERTKKGNTLGDVEEKKVAGSKGIL